MNIKKFKENCSYLARDPAFRFLILLLTIIIAICMMMIHGNSADMTTTWNSIGAALIVAIPTIALFMAAYVQLRKNREYQRAAFLSQYISKIFTNKEFSDTFHYLVYTYEDEYFCRVKMKLKDDGITVESGQKTMFQCLDSLPFQDGREEGFRFYHPGMFQGSAEERRLDSLLGYFNIIAYYYKKEKLLSMDDIDGSIGYHLTVIGERTVIAEYMRIMEEGWKKGKFSKKFGMQEPFQDLKDLLRNLTRERKVRRNGR